MRLTLPVLVKISSLVTFTFLCFTSTNVCLFKAEAKINDDGFIVSYSPLRLCDKQVVLFVRKSYINQKPQEVVK